MVASTTCFARPSCFDCPQAIQAHNIRPIDVVVVNLYPFRATVTAAQAPTFDVAVENIDIGGPAMLR